MSEKREIISPFLTKRKVKGQGNWDKDYISYEHKLVVKKTGDGEEDYVLEMKHIEHREPIVEVVNRDAGTTGILPILQRVALTGDNSIMPTPMDKTGVTNDYTNVPDNLLDAENYAKKMQAAFDALPEEIRKGRNFNDFCNSFGQDELSAYIGALMALSKPKTEKIEKKDGD